MQDENDNKGSVLTTLFESKEESLYALNEIDKEKIKNLTKDNDSYEKLFAILEDLLNSPNSLEKVRNSLDSYIDKINIIGAYENEKFYKIRIFRCSKFNIRMCEKIVKIGVCHKKPFITYSFTTCLILHNFF